MRALILAAGLGSRLMPLTKDRPKCMVEFRQKAMIDYGIEALTHNNIHKIGIVGGYKMNILSQYLELNKSLQISLYCNERFATTNMVYTMFCAIPFLQDCIAQQEDLIVVYSDIVYSSSVIERVKNNTNHFAIAVNTQWYELWNRRFEDVLSDAETLKIRDGKIVELGKKPKSLNEIDGQYMGIFKFSWVFLEKVVLFYQNMDQKRKYDGKDFQNMYMTSFLQEIILNLCRATPVFVDGDWVEIDSCDDLRVLENDANF